MAYGPTEEHQLGYGAKNLELNSKYGFCRVDEVVFSSDWQPVGTSRWLYINRNFKNSSSRHTFSIFIDLYEYVTLFFTFVSDYFKGAMTEFLS